MLISLEVPSCADIQHQLILEESKDISKHGQTNWIASGIKIQELQLVHEGLSIFIELISGSRLAIRYQLQTHGSKLTTQDMQAIENKQAHLQQLIDMFEHQADTFLLHQGSMDGLDKDLDILFLDDYDQYDHVDNLYEDSGEGKAPTHLTLSLGSQMALAWTVPTLRIILLSSHHPLDGHGVSAMIPNLSQSRKPSFAMLKPMAPFIAYTLLLVSRLPFSALMFALLRPSRLRPVHGMPYTVWTLQYMNMHVSTAWHMTFTGTSKTCMQLVRTSHSCTSRI